jgi:hypothetical protein
MASLGSAAGKVALDAMTDQSFAFARDHRSCAEPQTVRLGAGFAAIVAAQFPGQEETAGRVVMCTAQMLGGLQDQLGETGCTLAGELADLLALAAEQVVREAAERRTP